MILWPDNLTCEYIEKKAGGTTDNGQEKRELFDLLNYPIELKKKVTLLLHFKNYMEGNENKTELPKSNSKLNSFSSVYIKKWMRTKHAFLFRLSNKVVQVIFEDSSEIVMSSVSKKVSYLNKKGERSVYSLSSALESGN